MKTRSFSTETSSDFFIARKPRLEVHPHLPDEAKAIVFGKPVALHLAADGSAGQADPASNKDPAKFAAAVVDPPVAQPQPKAFSPLRSS